MEVHLDISKNLEDQFSALVHSKRFDPKSGYDMDKISFVELANGLELYHFQPIVHESLIQMTSTNPKESPWYLIHVNIGLDQQLKMAGDKKIDFHKFESTGVLMYCPGIRILTTFKPGHRTELFSIRFSKYFLEQYMATDFLENGQVILHENLDSRMEGLIRKALSLKKNKLKQHATVLELLDHFLGRVSQREWPDKTVNLHQSDVENLLRTIRYLRDPLDSNIPSLHDLAASAKMSVSKFKRAFKQLFGLPPHKYHFKIKMEYAREELLNSYKTPKELSFELGYAHPSNFSSAYKGYFKRRPSEDFSKGRE